jgi:hypothetical protein
MVDEPLISADDDLIEAIAEHAAANPGAELRADASVVIDQLCEAVGAARRAQRFHAPNIRVVGDGMPGAVEEQREPLFFGLLRNGR